MKVILSIDRLVYVLFLMLPILDSINGVLVRQYGKSIGTIYHVLLVVILLLFTLYDLTTNKRLYRRRELFAVSLIVYISVLVNTLFFNSPDNRAELRMKFICTLINLYCLNQLTNSGRLKAETCGKILEASAFMVPITIIFARVVGLGNTAYISSSRGFLGFYSSSNELNFMLLVFLCIILESAFIKKQFKYIVCALLLTFCSIMIESKISMGCVIIIYFLYTIRVIVRILRGNRICWWAPFVPFAVIGSVIVLWDQIISIVTSFLIRQNHLSIGLNNGNGVYGILNYFTSGRIAHANNIFEDAYGSVSDIGKIIRFFIGSGFYIRDDYFEMEFFDIFIWCGAIGLVIMIILFILLLKRVIYVQNSKFYGCLPIYMALTCIFFSGHVLMGGVAGVYFALLVVDYTHMNHNNSNLIIGKC